MGWRSARWGCPREATNSGGARCRCCDRSRRTSGHLTDRGCVGGLARNTSHGCSSNAAKQEVKPCNIVTVTKLPMTRCAWCGGAIGKNSGRGRPKRYCRPSHRQRAYESRRLATTRGLEFDDVLISRSSLEAHRDQLYLLEAAYEDVLTDSVDATAPQMLKTVRSLRRSVEAAVACDLEIRATGA